MNSQRSPKAQHLLATHLQSVKIFHNLMMLGITLAVEAPQAV